MLPPTIPIFPLPNAVLFPNVFMPLHIFEPRYRAMVSDALAGDRIIGMVLLRAGFERDYEGRPAIFPIGCAGVVTRNFSIPLSTMLKRPSGSGSECVMTPAHPTG
jgi:Lon protease-like protein